MPEIWVPYGPVEVSFDVKQENLTQIVEPATQKLSTEDISQKVSESVALSADSLLILSGTRGVSAIVDQILLQNNQISNLLYHPKKLASFAKKKAEEHPQKVQRVAQLRSDQLVESEEVIDGTRAKIPGEIKNSSNLVIITSLRYDPLFGLTSAASDLISSSPELKSEAFKKSVKDLPCQIGKSDASWFATRSLQACPNASSLEILERSGVGVLGIFSGEPESTHAKASEFWTRNLEATLPAKSQRIVFGCGGAESDNTLSDSLAHAFFNVALNASIPDADSKICMLADCSEGLGSEALLNFVTGKFDPLAAEATYFEGLEVLLSLQKVQKDLEVSLVSTLPKYYGEKFGFKMYSGAKEAPAAVVPHGSKAKMLVIPDASTTFFKSAG
jgi:hypothetical protein